MDNVKEAKNLIPFVKDTGKGETKYFELLNGKNSSKMHSGFVTLKPGEEIGGHSTGKNEEIIIMIEGSGIIEAAGDRKEVSAGQIAYNPPDTIHNVINSSGKILSYIFVVSEA